MLQIEHRHYKLLVGSTNWAYVVQIDYAQYSLSIKVQIKHPQYKLLVGSTNWAYIVQIDYAQYRLSIHGTN